MTRGTAGTEPEAPEPGLLRPGLRHLAFVVALRVPVGEVAERRGWLVVGPDGVGEWSPLPTWSAAERAAAAAAALEAATGGDPPLRRAVVEVNAMVPRVAPAQAFELARDSGCRTIKVKVGDPDGAARVAAVREALGRRGRIRLDANGAWDVDEALRQLSRLRSYDVELVEDPVAEVRDLAAVRRRSPVPVAAESCVRTVADAARVRHLAAADAVVLKPQRLGGVRAALAAAEAAGVPAIASSALETSVGLRAVVVLAAALAEAPFAHGAGTALLLAEDVVDDPLIPVNGRLGVRPVRLRRSLFGGPSSTSP